MSTEHQENHRLALGSGKFREDCQNWKLVQRTTWSHFIACKAVYQSETQKPCIEEIVSSDEVNQNAQENEDTVYQAIKNNFNFQN